ncbi:MAG: pantetheine-phosphate adenylyltransferase [Planctomycetota bacterium]
MVKVLYAGSFDPITFGHIDVVNRAIRVFPFIVIGVAENIHKKPLLTVKERVYLIKQIFNQNKNIIIKSFKGLVVDFMRKENINVLLRGIRTISDFEYEFQMALANRTLSSEIETVFIMSSEQNEFIRSSLIKEIAQLGGDISKFVPQIVADYIVKKLKLKKQHHL